MFKSATITKHINTTATKAFVIYDVIVSIIDAPIGLSYSIWWTGTVQTSSVVLGAVMDQVTLLQLS